MKRKRGFTLIEILITLVLFSIFMTMITSIITHCVRAQTKGIRMAKLRQTAHNAMDVISTDVLEGKDDSIGIYASGGTVSTIKFIKTDSFSSDASPSKGGDLTVTYLLNPRLHTIVRQTRYGSAVIAQNVTKMQFSSPDTCDMEVYITLELKSDVRDPLTESYSLSSMICRRFPHRFWTFGP